MDKICERYGCEYVALTCAVTEADAGDPGTLEAVAERWGVPVGALAAGITARRRWRGARGEPAVVFVPAGGVVVAS